jgi:ABC-2 type transport system ATP-binding protein
MTPLDGVPDLRDPDHEVPVGSPEAAAPRMGQAAPAAAAVMTSGLSKRYRKVSALTDCTITVPEGRITALIGPNGAGKTTLLHLLAGLAIPTAGKMTVNGGTPRQDPAFLAGIGFLAQEIPLYRRMSAADLIRVGAHLNPRWDGASVRERLTSLNIPLDRAVGKLSGGQRAQVALALTLAKQPRLLLLDEPVAALDPLARRNFLGVLADAVAADGLTVVMSSHLVADLERVCDHLIMLSSSRVQLCGDIEELLAEHQILVGPRKDITAIQNSRSVIQVTRTPRQITLLVRGNAPVADPAFQASDVSLEELVLAYLGQDAPPALTALSTEGDDQ